MIVIILRSFFYGCHFSLVFPLYTIHKPCFLKDFLRSSPLYPSLTEFSKKMHFCLDPISPNDGTPLKLTREISISHFRKIDFHCFCLWLFICISLCTVICTVKIKQTKYIPYILSSKLSQNCKKHYSNRYCVYFLNMNATFEISILKILYIKNGINFEVSNGNTQFWLFEFLAVNQPGKNV